MSARELRALRAVTADALSGVVAIPNHSPAYWHALAALDVARAHRRSIIHHPTTHEGTNR